MQLGPVRLPCRKHSGARVAAWTLLAAITLSVLVIAVPVPGEVGAADRPIPATFAVSLTASGFVPDLVTVVAGQTIAITNDTAGTRIITSGGDGTFDSGPISPGGAFVLALPSVGGWVASDDASPSHSATITVGTLELVGDPTSPANAALPDHSPPDGAVLIHPALGLEVTRNRILVAFQSSTTILQANAALEDAGLTIVGGNRDSQLLVTETADAGSSDLQYMQDALEILRSDPSVRTAAYDVSLNPNTALPRPADPDPAASAGQGVYEWDAYVAPDDTIRGVSANYGLEAARFPQAWNWLDAIYQASPVTPASATLVLDVGFDTRHPDLTDVTLHRLCATDGRCTDNPTGLRSDGLPLTTHGTQVAGLVGAEFDRGPQGSFNSQGTVGGDPASNLDLVPYFVDPARESTSTVALDSFLSVLDLILDKKPSTFSNLRVINLSAGFAFLLDPDRIPYFERAFGTDTCGPGDADDDSAPPAERVACTPNTKDTYLTEFRAAAELVRPLAARLASNNVLLVVAAGNDSDDEGFCAIRPRTTTNRPCDRYEPISTTNTDPFGYLASIWTPGVPPWVLVEADLATPENLLRLPFSNVDGTISAGGLAVMPYVDALGTPSYRYDQGTSFSAPLVSAAAGLLSSLTPSWATVRSLLVDRGPMDLANSTTPRLDVFSSLLGLPAARGIDALLDVNDSSPDGNRRVTYDDRGQSTGEDFNSGSALLHTLWTAPDGRIDMRDFRRYRDAWLDSCSGNPGCPEPESILLDGSAIHRKRDMNFDGCFISDNVAGCNEEGVFSRVDFNGDGTLLIREIPVLLSPSGAPAARDASTLMTDLDVFKTRFGEGPNADTEGWAATDLDRLLVSADVELRLDTLWAGGAESAEVTVSTLATTGPRLTFTPRATGDIRMYTVPITPVVDPDLDNSDLIQVRVVAELPGGEIVTYVSPLLNAKAGEDIVVVPCTNQFVVSAATPAPTPGGVSLISATLTDCTGRPVVGEGVDFEISAGPNGASISVVNATTDVNGVARTVFQYPEGVNSAAQVTASVYPALDGGDRLQGSVSLGPAADVVIHYRFRQTILDYERTSTNDWGPGEDDCDGPTDAGNSPVPCFSSTQTIETERLGIIVDDNNTVIGFYPYETELGELERRGTIVPNAEGGATIDDSGRSVQFSTSTNPAAPDVSGIRLETQVQEWDPANPAVRSDVTYYSDIKVFGQPSASGFADLAPLPLELDLVDFSVTPERLRVNNLDEFVAYGITPSTNSYRAGSTTLPPDTNADLPIPNPYQSLQQIPEDLAFFPRNDLTSFKWDWNPQAPLEFTGNGDGTYQPSSWCGVSEKPLYNALGPGFWNDTDPAIIVADADDPPNRVSTHWRSPDDQYEWRRPGDRAAPRQSGSVEMRFEFVAVVTAAGAPAPDLAFPNCEESEPAPIVGFQPAQPVEGQRVDFSDLSQYSDAATNVDWRFSDPDGSDPAPASHRFSDDGTYIVDFTLTDSNGVQHTSDPADVVVENAPPTLELLPPTGGGRSINVRVDDAGPIDRQWLELSLTSPTPGWPSGGVVSYTTPPIDPVTGELSLDPWTETVTIPDTLTPGVYFVVLSVKDKDGGKASTSFSLAVSPPAPESGLPGGGGGGGGGGLSTPLSVGTALIVASARAALAHAASALPQQGAGPSRPAQAPPATTESAPPAEPVPAVVVDQTDAATGELIVVHNVTRTAGAPAAAIVDAGDGRTPLDVGPDATISVSYGAAANLTLGVRGLSGSTQANVALTIEGDPIPSAVAYEGVAIAPVGAAADVVAHVTGPVGSDLVGVAVRFTMDGQSAQALTGSDGRARTQLRITGATGARDLVVTVLPGGDPLTVPFTVTANSVPMVDAGGPYDIGVGAPLTLSGSATDADAGEQATLVFQWDLDADGAFDDAIGPEPSLTPTQVSAVVCGGVCDPGEVVTITLRVSDAKGAQGFDTSTVAFVRDFALTVSPSTATLVPNANVSFSVGVISSNGFTGSVVLTAPGLPAGITASFQPATVTPDGSSLLTLRASDTFSPQDFDVVVRGTSGSIVREVGAELQLEFGLIPECFGSLSGRVTNIETGAGLAGVNVAGAVTDANGNYSANRLALEAGNAPRLLFVSNLGAAYYPLSPQARVTVACGVPATLDIALRVRQFGALTGTISGVDVDGSPLGPLAGVEFSLNRTTGADGTYSLTNLPLGEANAPVNSGVLAKKPGYHNATATAQIIAGTTTTLDVVMLKVCTASVRVRVLDQATGRVVPNARVDSGQATTSYLADANGIAIVPSLPLGAPDNRPIQRVVRALTPVDVSPVGITSESVVLGRCGAQIPVDIELSFPRRVESIVDVLVVDDAGAPVPDAIVGIGQSRYSSTGPDGRLTITHLFGFDAPPTLNTAITAFGPSGSNLVTPPGTPITLTEGERVPVTITLIRRKFGAVEGTVRDRATGAPLGGIRIGSQTTGADGRYSVEGIGLNGVNQPALFGVNAEDGRVPPQYWSAYTQVTVRADEVTQVPDLLMLRICDAGTIRGRVVNAVDRTPIEGALVRVGTMSTLTDVDGRFVITNIGVGVNNADQLVTVIASKTGFVTAQKNVTISCGADVVVDFGTDGDGVGSITGIVTSDAGLPVNGARVTTGYGAAASTNNLGRYTLANAPAGVDGSARDWSVRVVPPVASELGSAASTATVRADETTTLDFVLATLADDPPVAASFDLTIEPAPTAVTLAGSDPTNDPLTFSVVTAPTNGTLTGTPPNLTYTPTVGFAGVDTITYTASDGPNTSPPGVIRITVSGANQAPVARVTAPTEVDEGSGPDVSASTSSDPDGTITTYDWDLDNDGAYDDSTGVDTSVPRFDDNGDVVVGLRVTDDRGGTGTSAFTIRFRNVAPILVLDDAIVDAESVELYGDVDDPGRLDTFSGTIDFGDGAGSRPLTSAELAGTILDVGHTYGAGGTFTITVTVCDDDGGCDTLAAPVVIAAPGNVAPVARITGPADADEGDSVEVSGATSSDVDGTIQSYEWDLDDDGSFDDATGPIASVTSGQDGLVLVRLRAVDNAGGAGIAERTITYSNVAPTLAPIAEAHVGVGGLVEQLVTFSDPGQDDWTALVTWSDGESDDLEVSSERSFTVSRTFAATGTFTASVEVCDEADCDEATLGVVVEGANAAPTARIDGPSTLAEGSTADLDGSGSSDDNAVVSWAWDMDGDGVFDDATSPMTSLTCLDDGMVIVALRVTDVEGSTATTSSTVSCSNVTPSVEPLGAVALEVDEPLALTGTFTDPGADEWTATVDYGDGAGPEPLALDGFSFTLSRSYSAAGAYELTVDVCDDDDSCGTAHVTVQVAVPPPDPQADLTIVKSHLGDARAGTRIDYVIGVTNLGPDPARNVAVTDVLPSGLAFGTFSGAGWSCTETSGTVRCTLSGALGVGAAAPLVLSVDVAGDAPAGVVINAASVEGSPNSAGNDTSEDRTTIVARQLSSDLSATVAVSDADLAPGDPVMWTLTVTNVGPDDTGPVTAAVEVPAGIQFTGIGGQGAQGLRLRQAAVAWVCNRTATGLVCTSSEGIASGATAQLALEFVVAPDALGTLFGSVTVSSVNADPNEDDNTFAAELRVTMVPATTVPATTVPATTVPATTVPATTVPVATGGQPVPTTGPTTMPGPPRVDPVGADLPPGPVVPSGGLPATGGSSNVIINIGVLLMALGLLLVAARRRPHRRRG